jgi:large subunit ribosomal protein L35
MPKMKPHSGMKKRVKVTGTGKIRHGKARRVTHLMQKKGTGRTRLDDGMVSISKNDTPRVKKMLGL